MAAESIRQRLFECLSLSPETSQSILDERDDYQSHKLQSEWLEQLSKEVVSSAEHKTKLLSILSHQVLQRIGEQWLGATDGLKSAVSGTIQEEENDDAQIREIDDVNVQSNPSLQGRLHKATMLARILRNIVVDNKAAQEQCFDVVPAAISALWHATSFTLDSRKEVHLLMRSLVQMMSNIVTEHNELQGKLWTEQFHMDKENAASQRQLNADKGRCPSDLVCRLLQSNDIGAQTATQVLLVNVTLNSRQRMHDLINIRGGGPLVIRALLHIVDVNIEEDEAEEEEEETEQRRSDGDLGYGVSLQPDPLAQLRQQRRFESLGITYALFKRAFHRGLFDQMFACLCASTDEGSPITHIHTSLITSAQITLLKVLDAYLHSKDRESDFVAGSLEIRKYDLQSLSSTFERLAQWSTSAMRASLQQDAVSTAVDARLVEVHVGLILVIQCLSSIVMATNETGVSQTDDIHQLDEAEAVVRQIRSNSFVKTLLSLMQTTTAFSPAISPFKATAAGAAKSASSTNATLPEGHVLSSTGKANTYDEQSDQTSSSRPRLDNLKRDLVGLLGTIAFRRSIRDTNDVQRVQDTVRQNGGLLDVLNLTQLDERNPYIRERAIFALRNLLNGNQASQDFIDQLKPLSPAEMAGAAPTTTATT